MSSSDPAGRFVDLCAMVQDLFNDIGLEPDPYPIKISERLIPGLEKKLKPEYAGDFKIHLEAKDWESKNLRAMLVRHKTKAYVWYLRSLNLCYRRFVVCKELGHLLVDSKDHHFTDDPVALVHQLVNRVSITDAATDLASEQFATWVAVELLIPWHKRKMLQGMLDDGATDLEVAHKIKAPEKIVSLVFGSAYGTFSAETHAKLSPPDDEEKLKSYKSYPARSLSKFQALAPGIVTVP